MAELRTHSKFLEKPKIEELLQSKRDGVLCFTNGQSPLGYAYYEDDTLYFGMNPNGRKYDYFLNSKNVCFTMYQTFPSSKDKIRTGWWSVILDGELSQITDPEKIKNLADTMEKKGLFPPGLKDKFLGVILKDPDKSNFFMMKITHFSGKEMPEYRPEDEVE
jgi:nitroimidazol reductase NimA-like FMN-containing flavoprotein (pyridoxamine 5'-phosphate oxidase superfamily)